jgi:exodeoxyribonuclease V beta subunit
MNLSEYPIDRGRYLIEASAGTGKTYTITHLILRLILQGVPVRKILVTTFSNAAADELKARILALLNEELANLIPAPEAADAAGAYHPDLFTPAEDLKSRILLQLAVSSIDEMTVSTIHGFCQKMLREFALKSGKGFEVELVPDESPYRDRLVRAFCRERFYTGGASKAGSFDDLSRAAAFASEPVDRDSFDGEKLDEKQTLRRDVYRYVRDRLPAELEKDGAMSFNDMIRDLDAALQADDGLAKLIRARYQAVFVDEFQDTDRIQYRIFDRCFPRGCPSLFYMIGDPKQAIYGFRGADIYTYLRAKNTADARFTLTKNFRSSPAMIEAVNRMFGDGELDEGHTTEGVFLQNDIPFVSIASGKGGEDFPDNSGGSLRLRHYAGQKDECARRIAEDVVREIRYLLSENCPVRVFEGDDHTPRPLRASDIAILVQRHEEAAGFVAMLNREGIAASACKSGKVYDTDEAKLMRLLLRCFLHPDMRTVRGLMLSPFFRISAADAAANPAWCESLMKQLSDCGRVWSQSGFPAAFLQFLDTPFRGESPRGHILSEFNGERVITNLIQLMELLFRKESEEHLLPEDVYNSLNAIIEGHADSGDAGGSEDNPDQLRLDRDSASVQILTMFAAKGLEFPVVFIPYPAMREWKRMQYGVIASRINTAAQAGQTSSPEDGEIILDFSMSDTSRATARDEEFRSSLRLLYVALTRASLITYLYTRQLEKPSGQAMNFTNSAQGALLMSHERTADTGEKSAGTIVEQRWMAGYFTGSRDLLPQPTAAWWTDLDEPENGGAFHVKQNGVFERHFGMRDDIGPLRPDDAPESLAAAEFSGEVRDDWSIMSFSAFHNILNDRADAETETPADLDECNDALSEAIEPETDVETQVIHSADVNLFRDFPRGATVGSMTHKLLEICAGHFDLFASTGQADSEAVQSRVSAVLREFGYDSDNEILKHQLIDGVSRTLQISLPGMGISLSELSQDRMVPEMEFFLDAPASLDIGRITGILSASASEQARTLVEQADIALDKKGILNGIIDLVFEHDGKYYIVDWKTNWLGGSDADYAPDRVRDAMGHAGYVLQSYLYAAALLQMLRQRGMDYGSFGGVYYFFLRGLKRGTQNGIWFDAPPRDCLENLLTLFRKGNES